MKKDERSGSAVTGWRRTGVDTDRVSARPSGCEHW